MSESIQRNRRADRTKDWLSSIAVALVLAMLGAAVVEAGLFSIGLALRDVGWYRGWMEELLTSRLDGIQSLPVVGALVSSFVDPKSGWLPDTGILRDLVVLTPTLFVFCLGPAARIGPTLFARFDEEALRPPPPADLGLHWAGPLGAVQNRVWTELEEWCRKGMGDGNTPFWHPWEMPEVHERFSLALMIGENGGGKTHLAEALTHHLDRSEELAALAGKSRLAVWRLQLSWKWREMWWWRARDTRQPWDCGYLVGDPAALSRLAHFRPRRPTLLIADELNEDGLDSALKSLLAARMDFRHPVRMLVINVALPVVLKLRYNYENSSWNTTAHDLGRVPVIDFSGSRFQVVQLRALVGAQPSSIEGASSHLLGRDADWLPVTSELDEQPILLAEAVRWVRAEATRKYEDLLSAVGLSKKMVSNQDQRSEKPVMLPVDILGTERELLRERILAARVVQRKEALLLALGSDATVLYRALLVASVAGGGSLTRLQEILSLEEGRLDHGRFQAAFGHALAHDWIPPLKPTIVADEMLRAFFSPKGHAKIADATQKRVRDLIHQAWLLNPAGASKTAVRWRAQGLQDEFAQIMSSQPTLDELDLAKNESLRPAYVCAFVEIAVLHGGDLETARNALKLLNRAEWSSAYDMVQALLLHPDARGLPALLLWLETQRLTFPEAGVLSTDEAQALGVRSAQEALHLLRQCVVVSVPVTPWLEAALEEAAFAALPLLARYENALASSNRFCELAAKLDHTYSYSVSQAPCYILVLGTLHKIRGALLLCLLQTSGAEKAALGWPSWVLFALRQIECFVETPEIDDLESPILVNFDRISCAPWTQVTPVAAARVLSLWCDVTSGAARDLGIQRLLAVTAAFPDVEEIQLEGAKQIWRVDADRVAVDAIRIAEYLDQIFEFGERFEWHEEIQSNLAHFWLIIWKRGLGTDFTIDGDLVKWMTSIAGRYPNNEDIQFCLANIWVLFALDFKHLDIEACRNATQKALEISENFKSNERIQSAAATSLYALAMSSVDTEFDTFTYATHKIFEIGERFPWEESIQETAAKAGSYIVFAQSLTDRGASEEIAQRVISIAERFQQNEVIQETAARATRSIAYTYRDSVGHTFGDLTLKVAAIAKRFELNEDIQWNAAKAWLIFALKQVSVEACQSAVEQVAAIAERFRESEKIQCAAAEAWRCLALAFVNHEADSVGCHRAVERVNQIAKRFKENQSVQLQAARAWRYLAWAYLEVDCSACMHAAGEVSSIAECFLEHEGIQEEAAGAWSICARSYARIDATISSDAAKVAGAIAERFLSNETVQYASAKAWRSATLSAVKFEMESLIAQGMKSLDKVTGISEGQLGSHIARGRIFELRQEALDAVQAWRQSSGPGA